MAGSLLRAGQADRPFGPPREPALQEAELTPRSSLAMGPSRLSYPALGADPLRMGNSVMRLGPAAHTGAVSRHPSRMPVRRATTNRHRGSSTDISQHASVPHPPRFRIVCERGTEKYAPGGTELIGDAGEDRHVGPPTARPASGQSYRTFSRTGPSCPGAGTGAAAMGGTSRTNWCSA
jgi:hypothetical protein